MSVALVFRGVGKIYRPGRRAVPALAGIDLEIPEKSFTAVVGASGCGKSTLLMIAAGLDTAHTGEVIRFPSQPRTGFLFQAPRLLPWLTAEQNVAFVLEAQGMARPEACARARDYLQLVGLTGFERTYPAHLSGGMQQRVALARALAVEPDLMLMDEPFASLDELTARRLRKEVLRLFRERPRTVLFVTHNVTEAVYLADRVVVLTPRPGRVQRQIDIQGPRQREYDDPEIALIARDIIRLLEPDENGKN